jgi:ribosomal-protein-alanine N-acetyltransferase
MGIQDSTGLKALSTRRLVLRALELADSGQVAALRSDEKVNQYLSRPACVSEAEAKVFIRKIQAGVANNGWYYWAIDLKEERQLIGTVCLWNIDRENSTIELGYELLPVNQGKGLMFEALEKVIDFAFGELKFKKIMAVTNQFNSRSVRLLEKFGFVRDQNFAGDAAEGVDDICFGLVRM